MNRAICESLEYRRLLSVSFEAELVEYHVAADQVEALGGTMELSGAGRDQDQPVTREELLRIIRRLSDRIHDLEARNKALEARIKALEDAMGPTTQPTTQPTE